MIRRVHISAESTKYPVTPDFNEQRSVLELIAEGQDDSYIALNLGLEEESVAAITTGICERLGLEETSEPERRSRAVESFFMKSTSLLT